VRQRQAEALGLERRLADLVNQAYGLTPEDVDLLWRTAHRACRSGSLESTCHEAALLCNRISSLTDKEMPMISELDMVVLTRDLSEHGLQKGDVGTIVHVYNISVPAWH